MRKRKQVLAAVLAGMFVFSLTACAGSNTAARQTEGVQETEKEAEVSSEAEEALEEDANANENANANADGIVQTTAGLVQGTNADGIYRYLGVPYAEAKERFVPAEDATPWEGIRMADAYGPISPQGAISGLGSAGEQEGTDNNSQNLNIWTPGVNDGEKRPVMVWLHGGGAKVLALMTSPYAKGLFQKGIVQSGATETVGVIFNSQESSTRVAEKILAKLGITAENIEDIQTVSVGDLEAAAAEQVDTTTIRLPLLKIMTHKADQKGAPVYAYLFTYGNSYHGAEIPYVFNHADGNEEEQALAEQISQSWINFARTGTPGAEGMHVWEPYTRESGATMLLDTEPELVYHHDQELLSILVPDYEY